jgi:hypothetical protein
LLLQSLHRLEIEDLRLGKGRLFDRGLGLGHVGRSEFHPRGLAGVGPVARLFVGDGVTVLMEEELFEDDAFECSLPAGGRKVDSGASTRQECQGKGCQVNSYDWEFVRPIHRGLPTRAGSTALGPQSFKRRSCAAGCTTGARAPLSLLRPVLLPRATISLSPPPRGSRPPHRLGPRRRVQCRSRRLRRDLSTVPE